MSGFRLRVCAVVSAVIGLAGAAMAQDGIAPQSRFPKETYAFMSYPSVSDTKTRLMESSFGKLWNDASMADFREEFSGWFDKISADFQEETGLSLSSTLGLISGEVTGGVSKVRGKVGAVLIADVGEEHETLARLLEKLEASIKENDGEIITEKVGDQDVRIISKGNNPLVLAYFSNESHVAVSFGQGIEVLKEVIARWDGKKEQSFDEHEVFTAILKECEDEKISSDTIYFIDPVNLVLEIMKANPETAGNAGIATVFLPQLGLDKVKGIGGAIFVGSDEFESVTRTMFYVEQPANGLPEVFHFPATLTGPPKWVGADVHQYTAGNWDVLGAYTAISNIYTMFTQQPGGLDSMLDQLADHPNNPGIHPKKDVLEQLTGEFHIISNNDSEVAEDDELKQPMLIGIGIKDEVTIQNVLEKVAAQVPTLKPRSFEGQTLYDIEIPNSENGLPVIGVSRKHLFFTTDPAILETVIRGRSGSEESLADSDDYKLVAKHFPAKVSGMSFGRLDKQIEPLWNMLRDGDLGEAIEGLDLSKLPEFNQVSKYFSLSGSYLVPHEKGGISTQFSLPVE